MTTERRYPSSEPTNGVSGVGLLTIHGIQNYGSVLQAFASQRVISGTTASDCTLIDYCYPNPIHETERTRVARVKSFTLSRGNRFLKNRLPGKPYARYRDSYASAVSGWQSPKSMRYPTRQSLVESPPLFHHYVVGSDQVWHPRTVARDPSFFLDFAPSDALRTSFASSFGCTELPPALTKYYRQHLMRLDNISVREESGAAIIYALTGRRASVVLDPTLLLSEERWRQEAIMPAIDEPYILCYGMNASGGHHIERLARDLARRTGFRVIRMNGWFHNAFSRSATYVLDAGPREFLGYVARASVVLAASFHGTAFAISFQRPFVSLLRGDPAHDARQRDLLSLTGLESHARVMDGEIDSRTLPLEAPANGAYARLSEAKERSLAYLADSLA